MIVRQDVEQPVGVGRDDRLPHRQRFEGGDRRPFPERRKDAQVERRQRAGDVAAEAGEHEAVAEPERARPAPEVRQQRPLADEKEPRAGRRGDDPSGGVDQVRVALGFVQPRDGADGELVRRAMPSSRRAAAISAALRARLNSSSGTPR